MVLSRFAGSQLHTKLTNRYTPIPIGEIPWGAIMIGYLIDFSHEEPDVSGEEPMESPHPQPAENLIKVSSRSRSTAVAGAIAAVIRNSRQAEVQAIGAGAVNQAVKALAIAATYLEDDHIQIANTIYFIDIDIDGEERTAVRFSVMTLP